MAKLARWLGPWASPAAAPSGIVRESLTVEGAAPGARAFEAWVYYAPNGPYRGAYLISPGLHFAGPSDSRMDRFCRVLASSGFVVMAPFLPDYTALKVEPEVVGDLARAFDVLERHKRVPHGVKPAILSISFGSMPALRVASSAPHRNRVGGLVVFGGYADWRRTVAFAMSGRKSEAGQVAAHDPLNQPVIFINLIESLPGAPRDPSLLLRAWRTYVERTWGRPELKVNAAHVPVAQDLARELPQDLHELFLIGCRALPGAEALCESALATERRSELLDPRPHLSGLTCPVTLIHGLDDDVIPPEQMALLVEAMPGHVRCDAFLTGLYGHSAQSEAPWRAPVALAKELRAMISILRALLERGGARA